MFYMRTWTKYSCGSLEPARLTQYAAARTMLKATYSGCGRLSYSAQHLWVMLSHHEARHNAAALRQQLLDLACPSRCFSSSMASVTDRRRMETGRSATRKLPRFRSSIAGYLQRQAFCAPRSAASNVSSIWSAPPGACLRMSGTSFHC